MIHANPNSVEYQYSGKTTIVLDDHHDEYEVDFVAGDKFTLAIKKNKAHIVHEDAPKITFIAEFTDKKYIRLMKASKPTVFVFMPHPKHPCYPVIHDVSMDIVPMLYEYFNDKLFNGLCPKQVVFKATTSTSKTAGLAEFAPRAGGKRSFRLSLRMDRIKHDPFLFVDVLIHEMIHLCVYQQYANTGDRTLIEDGHGPAFQDHVKRINKYGFHINTYLDWETRTTLATAKDYFLIVGHLEDTTLKALFWSLVKPSIKELEAIRDVVRADSPTYGAHVACYKTSDHTYRTRGIELLKGFKIKGYISYIATELNNTVEILRTQFMEAATVDRSVAIKLNKRDMPFLVRSYDDYRDACRSRQAYDYGNAEAAWRSVPKKALDVEAKKLLTEAAGAVKKGMRHSEVSERLAYIPLIYRERVIHREYSSTIKNLIKTGKMDVLLNYPELDL